MSEPKKLFNPKAPEDRSLPVQLTDIFTEASQQAGGYVVDHPEEHTFVVVFGAHQFTVTVSQR